MNKRTWKYQHILPGTSVRVYDHRDDDSTFFEGVVVQHETPSDGLQVLVVECNYDSTAKCDRCYCDMTTCLVECSSCRVGKVVPVPMEIINDFDGRIKIVIESARFVA